MHICDLGIPNTSSSNVSKPKIGTSIRTTLGGYVLLVLIVALSNGRDIRKGNAGIGADLEGSFFSFGETSLVVLNRRCEGEMEEGCRVSLWGDDSRR